MCGSPDIFNLHTKGLISSVSSKAKESKNMGAQQLNNDIFVEAELNIIRKNIKKGISSITDSGITLTTNEIKDIIKVIKSLENRGTL